MRAEFAGYLMLPALFLVACGGMCSDERLREITSVDGRYVGTAYIRDCGATTDFVTHVQIRRAGSAFDGQPTADVLIGF